MHRTISKEEMLHLFEFGDDENPDALNDLVDQDSSHESSQTTTGQVRNLPQQKVPPSYGSCSSDKLMESLLAKHCPRYILLNLRSTY